MGSSGKAGGGNDQWQMQAGQNAYNAASQGQDYNTIMGNSTGYEEAAQMGWDQWAQEQSYSNDMPVFDFGGGGGDTMSEEDRAAAEAAAAEEARIAGLESEYDALLSDRYGRATEAASHIGQRIDTEQSRADLYGLTYEMTDEMRAGRVNDYFGTIWGAESESRLGTIAGELGREFDTGGVMRGEGGDPGDPADDTKVSAQVPGGGGGTVVTDPDDNDLLGEEMLLGGL